MVYSSEFVFRVSVGNVYLSQLKVHAKEKIVEEEKKIMAPIEQVCYGINI